MTDAIDKLLRPEIAALSPYVAASYADGLVRLNANETPWPAPGTDEAANLNHYPPERADELTAALAGYYGVPEKQLLVTRGSSEAIDLLIRCFCRAGEDEIVVCPPTFGMYRVYADIQGASVRQVPLREDEGFSLDIEAILDSWQENSRLLFLCSPNNPTGNRLATEDIRKVVDGLAGRGVVVIDGAYADFDASDPGVDLLLSNDNVVVLRTLSKSMGLAGARCGAMLAPERIIDIAGRVMPPYALPKPTIAAALASLAPENRSVLEDRIATLMSERERLAKGLSATPGVVRVWPSAANFLYCEVANPRAFVAAAQAGGILVRDFSGNSEAGGGLRITVGTPEQNQQLIKAVEQL